MSLQNDIKIIFLGKCETGKTKLLNKWTRNEFNDEYHKTEISDLESKIYEITKKNIESKFGIYQGVMKMQL